MSLKIRFKFDGKCPDHPRYNPAKDGKHVNQLHGMQPCAGCDDLWCIYLYTTIANRRAEHAKVVKSGQTYNFAEAAVVAENVKVAEAKVAEKIAIVQAVADELKGDLSEEGIQKVVKESRSRRKKTEKTA